MISRLNKSVEVAIAYRKKAVGGVIQAQKELNAYLNPERFGQIDRFTASVLKDRYAQAILERKKADESIVRAFTKYKNERSDFSWSINAGARFLNFG